LLPSCVGWVCGFGGKGSMDKEEAAAPRAVSSTCELSCH